MVQCCNTGNRLVYACSGGADVGEIADRVARQLVKEGFAKPSCLAGVGGHVSGFIASAQGTADNIVIDG
ncbi:MAG: putative zinc-binding protein, partial [bacterium]